MLTYWIIAAICAVTVLVVILIDSTLWRRMPAVRDNGEAVAGGRYRSRKGS